MCTRARSFRALSCHHAENKHNNTRSGRGLMQAHVQRVAMRHARRIPASRAAMQHRAENAGNDATVSEVA